MQVLKTSESFGQMMPNVNITIDNMMSEWGDIPYCQLSIILVHLRALSMIHQTNHWICKGDSYYGDHLLFERLYNETLEEIDSVAEKAVGLGNESNVNVSLQIIQVYRLIQGVGQTATIPQPNSHAETSLNAETSFLHVLEYIVQTLKDEQKSSLGLENMLSDIADKHEKHVYLLKQRTNR